MIEALKPLLESGLVNEETRNAINEAWANKLKDISSQIRTEIREEFAGRYEHDKEVMVKTLDKMVAETLTSEVRKIKEDQIQITKLKIQTVKEMKGAVKKINTFMVRALAEELAEFSQERKLTESHRSKLEKFIMSSLAEEINEFAEDKRDLARTKVKLVSEAKGQIKNLKSKFVKRSAKAVSEIVAQTLNHELTQLHEDIKVARQNNFGRKIFEAFATEFTGTYLNENIAVKKLKTELDKATSQLSEAKKVISKKNVLLESKQKESEKIKNRADRNTLLSELLTPLDRSKRDVMSQLLESVQTGQLRSAYDKYLPAVLNNRTQSVIKTGKSVLQESTGNRTTKAPIDEDSLADIKRLAGI